MLNIWELYQRQVVADHRTVLINKVMYVNMMIVSYLFHQPHARVGPETEDVRYEYDKGFETVMYNVTLKVGLRDLGRTRFINTTRTSRLLVATLMFGRNLKWRL